MMEERSTREHGFGPERRVTVGVLNYNYGHYIDRCLTSILRQVGTDFDVVVVNDASTDDSLDHIENYLNDPRVHLVDHEQNQGFCRSLAAASTFGDSEFLVVVSADDWLVADDALTSMVDALDADPSVTMAFGAYGHYEHPERRDHLTRFGDASWQRPGIDAFDTFLDHGIPLHSGTLIRRLSYEAVGGYDATLRYALDIQIFYLLCQMGTVAYVDRELVAWRRHAMSMTKNLDGVDTTIREVFGIIDRTMALAAANEVDPHRIAALRKRARQRALVMFADDAVFNDRRRLAWRLFRVGLRISPREALVQRAVPAMLVRAVLGDALSSSLRRMLGHRAPARSRRHE